MYLSRLHLEPRSRDARIDLSSCSRLHGRILEAFGPPGSKSRTRAHVLFRVDIDRHGEVILLVQSSELPDWHNLPTGYVKTYDETDGVMVKSIDDVLSAIRTGDELRFRLRANPTRKVDTKSGPAGRNNGRRVFLKSEQERLDWLQGKAERHGFLLIGHEDRPSVIERDDGWSIGKRRPREDDDDQVVRLRAVVFDGALRVADLIRFNQALSQGIGSGKAYGFGLLSIAPMRDT